MQTRPTVTRPIGATEKYMSTLTSIDLSNNGIGDKGSQRVAQSIGVNSTIKEVILSRNSVSFKTCFVFSQILRGHKTLSKLDLSNNPLGEAGSRCLFRTILSGVKTFVMMRDCTFEPDPRAFNHSNPSLLSPYELDMQQPYDSALLDELLLLVSQEENHITINSLQLRERKEGKEGSGPGILGPEKSINLITYNGEIVIKSSKLPFRAPQNSTVKVAISQVIHRPTVEMALKKFSLDVLILIVVNAKSEIDRKNWLSLMCADVYFTTSQAQEIIDALKKRGLLGVGLTIVDIYVCVWTKLLDTENKYDFMCRNLDAQQRQLLAYACSFEKFKFNWVNPTGHWRLDLASKAQRDVMMQLIALNNSESVYSEKSSGRNDTSQKGNWNNFRNESFRGLDNTITIDRYR